MAQNNVLDFNQNNESSLLENKTKTKNNIETNDLDTVKNAVNEIKNSYANQMPKLDWSKYENELKTKDYTQKKDDVIAKEVTDKLEDFKKANINKILTTYNEDSVGLDTKQNQILNGFKDEVSDIKNNAILNRELINHQAISNGVERSSIMNNEQQNNIDNQFSAMQSAQKNYETELSSIELKRELVEAEKELALENFDIKYANKLQTEINKLKTNEAKLSREVAEYNAQIDKRKSEIQTEFDNANKDNIATLNDNMQRDIAMKTFALLKNVSKEKAREILQDPEIADALGNWLSILSIWVRDY